MRYIKKSEYEEVMSEAPDIIKNYIVINLEGEKKDIIRTMASSLRGEGSISMESFGNNLDALNDVLGDWFLDTWFEQKEVYILGFSKIFENDMVFGLKLIDMLSECGSYMGMCLMRWDVDEKERENIYSNSQNKYIHIVLDDSDF